MYTLVAESPIHLESAHTLVCKRYASRGYEIPERNPELLGASFGRQLREITFLATTGITTLGTVTLRLDGPGGLLAEITHKGVIERSRVAGGKACELTRFAVADNVDSKAVLLELFRLAHAVGFGSLGLTDVFIEVNPKHVGFYTRVFGFEVAASEKLCERVQAQSVLLRSEVKAAGERIACLTENWSRKATNMPRNKRPPGFSNIAVPAMQGPLRPLVNPIGRTYVGSTQTGAILVQ